MSKHSLASFAAFCLLGLVTSNISRAEEVSEVSSFLLVELRVENLILHNTNFRVDLIVEPEGPETSPIWTASTGDYMVVTLRRTSTGASAGQSPNIPVTFTDGIADPTYTMMTAPDLGMLGADEYQVEVQYYSFNAVSLDSVLVPIAIQK